MDYKDTLLMGKTDFQMKGNLPENEKLQRQKWDELDLYNKIREKNKGRKPFVLHDGPPYANGNIHIGHAMNKILKDFINRYKAMAGFDMSYIPGWDTHGLPIEQAVTNTGVDRKSMSKADFRKLCEEYAYKQIEIQKAGFRELNILGEWDNPYITLKPEMEARQIEVFAEMAKKGLIFKGLRPVYWSPSSESALAEAEIEYKDKKDPSIFVAFPVVEGNDKVKEGEQLIIWTTTPWTLPGNLGIAVGEQFNYAKVLVNDNLYILAESLVESLAVEFGWEEYKVVETLKGTDFDGVKYKHVFMDRVSPVVIGYHVTLDAGTGLVHIAPGYGADDFNIGKEYELGMIDGVNDQGYLTDESGKFSGLFYDDANKVITQELDEMGVLIKLKFITHSYPHDWRTKKPIIFRATPQWFCSIEKIRKPLLNEIENNVKFHTQWGQKRLYNMIRDRGDWCISRQRVWGVPIPIFYNEDGSEILDYDVMMHVAKLFREHGSNIWFEKDETFLLPEGYTNEHSPNGIFRKEKDIMDVWFDSGSSHTGCMKERGYRYPVDLYFEGSDQYRGWFNSSLIVGTAAHGCAPYKTVLSHGFVLDGKGNKMSKSLGNTVDPIKVVNQYGADILRLWATSVAYQSDVRISDEIMKGIAENYRKMRNTMRFVLGNLNDFKQADLVEISKLEGVDKYVLVKLNALIEKYNEAMTNYDFAEANQLILNYFTNLLSAFYMDFTKDILYLEEANSLRRRQVQTVLYYNAKTMMKLLSPVLVFTAEELHDHFHCDENKEESVFLEANPTVLDIENSAEIEAYYDRFFTLRKDVLKSMETLRENKIIKSNMEAKLTVNLKDEFKDMADLANSLQQLFIVAKVELVDSNEGLDEYESAYIKAEKFDGVQCPRCWNYFDKEEMNGELCPRCAKVINK